MAIGVSYTGIGGRRTNFTAAGGNAAFEELRRLQSESGSMLQQMMQRRVGGGGSAPKTTNEQRRQMKERDRQNKYDRLAERGIFRDGKKTDSPFADAFRRQKYGKDKEVDLDKIDPRRSGKDITGGAKSDKEPSDTNRAASGKEPFTESYISDLFLEEAEDDRGNKTGGMNLYKYRRRRSNTGQGRVFSVSKEECEFVGAIPIGGGSGGGGGMFAWDETTRTMGAGGAMVGRTWVAATGTGSKSDGSYYLCVTFGSGGSVTAAVSASSGATTDTVCYIPIYTIADGKISADYRGAFVVPCWE